MKDGLLSRVGHYGGKRLVQGVIGAVGVFVGGNLINGTYHAISKGANYVQSLSFYFPITTDQSSLEMLKDDVFTGLCALGIVAACWGGAKVYNTFSKYPSGLEGSKAAVQARKDRKELKKQKNTGIKDIEAQQKALEEQKRELKNAKI